MESCNEIFEKVVKEILKTAKKDVNYQKGKCEDQYVGLLQIERKNARFSKWIKTSLTDDENDINVQNRINLHKELDNKLNIPVLAIMLESPHKNEYKNEYSMPACGKTGYNLYKFLPKYLNCINSTLESKDESKGIGYIDIKSGIYRVLLINAIQYQCSLGQKIKSYRNKVVEKMWANDIVKKDFESRIASYKLNIVINCCTSCDLNLRKKVQESINNVVSKEVVMFHAYHPCKWQECLGIEPDGWK